MSSPREQVRRRTSMAAAYHCHPSYCENPTLHIGGMVSSVFSIPFRFILPPIYWITDNVFRNVMVFYIVADDMVVVI